MDTYHKYLKYFKLIYNDRYKELFHEFKIKFIE